MKKKKSQSRFLSRKHTLTPIPNPDLQPRQRRRLRNKRRTPHHQHLAPRDRTRGAQADPLPLERLGAERRGIRAAVGRGRVALQDARVLWGRDECDAFVVLCCV